MTAMNVSPLRPRPRFLALPIMIASVGLGLTVYYGEQWYQLSQLPEAGLEQSVELNLMLDLQRESHKPLPGEAELQGRRERIRAELLQQLAVEKHELRGNLIAALAAFIGGALFLFTQLRPGLLFGRR